MKIAVLKERATNENRVAITPEIVKKLVSSGVNVVIEQGAGENALISDENYEKAGAKISTVMLEIVADANIILKVQPSPSDDEFSELKFISPNTLLIGLLSPYNNKKLLKDYAAKKVTSASMEFLPRITKAQSMDVLSSQSNLAGYISPSTTAAGKRVNLSLATIFPFTLPSIIILSPIISAISS